MHLVARAVGASQEAIMAAASGVGVEYQPISWFSAAPPPAPGLILGYAAYPPESSRRAMQAWARALGGT
jgi:GntR family transcriptional regulator/MocR family aminotransferase